MIKVEWSIEEMVAIVAIYFKSKLSNSYELKDELFDLSKRLNKRADILGIEHDEKYRNYNGMKKMFENIRYIDSNGEKGLSGASLLMKEVVGLYHSNNYVFEQIAKDFNEKN